MMCMIDMSLNMRSARARFTVNVVSTVTEQVTSQLFFFRKLTLLSARPRHRMLCLMLVSLLFPPGPWPAAPLPHPGPEATAVIGDQIQGALRLCVEGPAARRIRRRENLPHPGRYCPGVNSPSHLHRQLPDLNNQLMTCGRRAAGLNLSPAETLLVQTPPRSLLVPADWNIYLLKAWSHLHPGFQSGLCP